MLQAKKLRHPEVKLAQLVQLQLATEPALNSRQSMRRAPLFIILSSTFCLIETPNLLPHDFALVLRWKLQGLATEPTQCWCA